MTETLSNIGEKELIKRLKKFAPDGQFDNDTAIINNSAKKLLINNDLLVENIHFNNQTNTPKNIGWKAITTNLSDLACSGVGEILGVTIGLIAPPSTSWEWIEQVYEGISEALESFGGTIMGGDCSNGKEKVLSITAFGTLGPLNLHRSNALPGDFLVTSGPHGLSRLGLELLRNADLSSLTALSDSLKRKAIDKHQRPFPRLDTLEKLLQCKPNHLPLRAAGTDSSDGLLEAVLSICMSSNCQAIINHKSMPKEKDWPSGEIWDKWCLNGGEDYELVIGLPKEWANELLKIDPTTRVIGKLEVGPPQLIWDNKETIEIYKYSEFNHF